MSLTDYDIEYLIKFCERWKGKIAQETLDDNLAHYFDHFFSAYVIFNAIYSGVCNGSGDRDNATNKIISFIGLKTVNQQIIASHNKEINEVLNLFDVFTFCGKPVPKNNRDDQHLKLELESEDKKAHGLFWLIYEIRCNLFHGTKQYQYIQIRLLGPLCKILDTINDVLIEKLKQSSRAN